jgi:hypothetical protein
MNDIEFGKDFIAIYDRHGEVVRWVMQEWIEDPSIVLSIANAVRIASVGKDIRGIIEGGIGNANI